MLGYAAIRTHAMRAAAAAADAYATECEKNRKVLGPVGTQFLGAANNAIDAEGLSRFLAVTLPHWRPSANTPWKGQIVLATPLGGKRLSHRHLVEFYAVHAPTAAQRQISSRTIQRVLQVVGAAYHAARGDHAKVEAMLLALIDETGWITPAGLLETARETAAWAAPLGRAKPSAEAERACVLRLVRKSMARAPWPRAALEALQAEVAQELAQRREAEPREALLAASRPAQGWEGVRVGTA